MDPGLAKHHIHDIDIVHKRVMFIIEPDLSYHLALSNLSLTTLKIDSTSYVRNAMKKANNRKLSAQTSSNM